MTLFKLSDITNNPPVPLFSSNVRRPTEDEGIDPREIDKSISEIAGMVGRWNLFKKFILEALEVIHTLSLFRGLYQFLTFLIPLPGGYIQRRR